LSERLSYLPSEAATPANRVVFAAMVFGEFDRYNALLPIPDVARKRIARDLKAHYGLEYPVHVSPRAMSLPWGVPIWSEHALDEARLALGTDDDEKLDDGELDDGELDDGEPADEAIPQSALPGALVIVVSVDLVDAANILEAEPADLRHFETRLSALPSFKVNRTCALLLWPHHVLGTFSLQSIDPSPEMELFEEEPLSHVRAVIRPADTEYVYFDIEVQARATDGRIFNVKAGSQMPAVWAQMTRDRVEKRGGTVEINFEPRG
jgi:hypothetical protein